MEFIKLWEIFFRRKWLSIYVFLVVALTIIIAAHVITPNYKSKAKLLVDSSQTTQSSLLSGLGLKGAAGGGGGVSTMSADSSDPYDTDINLAKLRPILEQVITELDLKDRKGEAIKPDKLADINVIGKLVNYFSPQPYIKVSQYQQSAILEVVAYSRSAQEAADMANKISDIYIKNRVDRTRMEYKAARLFIGNQIKDIKDDYFTSLKDVKDFQVKNSTVDISQETQNLLSKLFSSRSSEEDNEKTIIEAEKRKVAAKQRIDQISMYRQDAEQFDPNDIYKALQTKLNESLVSLAEKGLEYAPEHPDYKKALKDVDVIRELIKNEEKSIGARRMSVDPDYDNALRKYTDAYIDAEAALAKRKILRKYIQMYEGELMSMPVKNNEFNKLQLKLTVSKDMYSKLLEYITQVGIAESMTLSSIKLIEPATVPDKVNYPKKPLMYGLALFLGMLSAMGVSLFAEYVDHTIKTPEDLKTTTKIPFLGTVPFGKKLRKQTIAHIEPTSPIVEALRTVRNSIRYTSLDRPLKTIVVTSSTVGEGKSSIASNLAIAYTMEEKRVLLLDLDLRIPSVHRIFGIDNGKGFTSMLVEGLAPEEVIHKTGLNSLDILTSGPIPSDPVRLVESKKTKEIIDSVKQKYDVVIIDTPPIIVDDAVVLGTFADGLLLVVEAGKIYFKTMEHINDILAKAGINPIGAVLNKFKSHSYRNSYYYKK